MSIIFVNVSAADVLTYPASNYVAQYKVEAGGAPAYYRPDVIHNAPPYQDVDRNMVRYEFAFEEAGSYTLSVEYASDSDRSCYIYWYVKGEPVGNPLKNSPVLGQDTGGWGQEMAHFRLEEITNIAAFKDTHHYLEIARLGVFPHIKTIKLAKVLA